MLIRFWGPTPRVSAGDFPMPWSMNQANSIWRSFVPFRIIISSWRLESVHGVSQVASLGGFVKQYQITRRSQPPCPPIIFRSQKSWKPSAKATGMWKGGCWNFPARNTWCGAADTSRRRRIWRISPWAPVSGGNTDLFKRCRPCSARAGNPTGTGGSGRKGRSGRRDRDCPLR